MERLRCLLDTKIIGVEDRLVYLPTVDSTNTQAMRLAQSESKEGVVVLTDSQVAGKGRQGRRWVDVTGYNALSSTILRPLFPPHLLVMVASLAVVDAIAATCDVAAAIKWPNDVLIGKRKVAGILIETSHDRTGQLVAIIGIGINVNGQSAKLLIDEPQSPQTNKRIALTATTLEEECGHPVKREVLLAHLLQKLEQSYLALQAEARVQTEVSAGTISRLIREQWRDQLVTLGQTVQVRQGEKLISGVAEDVNENGELLLRLHSGELISITWGDVG